MALEWVMIDDAEAKIVYSGDWFADEGSLDSSGSYGSPYLSTLHGIQGIGSLSYQFSGTSVIVTGAVQVPRAPNSANTTWQCIIDGTPISVSDPTSVDNRVLFCEGDNLADGLHSLLVNAIGNSQQTFWFDYLQYIPSPNVSLTDTAIMIDSSNPSLLYSPGWSSHYPGFVTNQTDASAVISFTGVSLIWYGFYDSVAFPFAETVATYSIDGSLPISFPLNGVAATQIPQWTQLLFSVNGLPAGIHTLEVVYKGNESTSPLSIETIVHAGTALFPNPTNTASPTSSPTASATPTFSNGSSPTFPPPSTGVVTSINDILPTVSPTNGGAGPSGQKHEPKINFGAILGPTIAGSLFLLAIGLVWLRHRRKQCQLAERTTDTYYPMAPPSFLSTPYGAVSQWANNVPTSLTPRAGSAQGPFPPSKSARRGDTARRQSFYADTEAIPPPAYSTMLPSDIY